MELSLFHPYTSKAPHHEDHLTWAFLNLVKLVPMVLSTFLDMVSVQQRQQGASSLDVLPPLSHLEYQSLTVQTQVSEIPQCTGRLISLVMTDDHWSQSIPVQPSDRGARFDGLLCFDPSWVLVIENKPRMGNIWEDQLHPPLPAGSELSITPIAVCLVWREVIEMLGSLVKRGLCRGLEEQLIEDFLSFVDAHFPYLNPYTSLTLCKGDADLLKRRCAILLQGMGLGDVRHDRGFEDYVRLPAGAAERVFLFPVDADHLTLDIYPGDTVSQARAMLAKLDRTELQKLVTDGWTIEPNLHFSFMSTHLV